MLAPLAGMSANRLGLASVRKYSINRSESARVMIGIDHACALLHFDPAIGGRDSTRPGLRPTVGFKTQRPKRATASAVTLCFLWLRGLDLNQRPLGYEPFPIGHHIPTRHKTARRKSALLT